MPMRDVRWVVVRATTEHGQIDLKWPNTVKSGFLQKCARRFCSRRQGRSRKLHRRFGRLYLLGFNACVVQDRYVIAYLI